MTAHHAHRTGSDIYEIVAGRQMEVLAALGINWNPARPKQHIRCPYPEHADKNPSWRWDRQKGMAHCTCGHSNIFGVVMKVRGCRWQDAADYCREVLRAEPWQQQAAPERFKPDLHIVENEPEHRTEILTPAEFQRAPEAFPGPTPDMSIRRDDIPRDGVLREHVWHHAGVPVLIKQRLTGEQKFRPWYRVGSDAWQNKQPDGFRPLPYVSEHFDPFAAGASGPLFWCEGERDVDSIAEHEIDAFTFGAAKYVPEGAEEYARGRDVIVPADNDEAGRDDAEKKAKRCLGIAASVKILRFPDLPEHGDISDWLENHSVVELQQLIAATREWPGKDLNQAVQSGKQLVVHRASEITPVAVDWLWPGRLAIGKTTLIGGDPGLGKSQLSMFMAATISQGGAWPCQEGKAEKRSVIILCAEDGVADTIVPRLMAADADRSKVRIVTAVMQSDGAGRRIFNLSTDLDALEILISETGDVGLSL